MTGDIRPSSFIRDLTAETDRNINRDNIAKKGLTTDKSMVIDETAFSQAISADRQTTPVGNDPVNNPKHYTSHPSGVECIDVTEHMNFNLGNCMKYIWRAGLKGNYIQDLKKAAWYLLREINRLETGRGKQ